MDRSIVGSHGPIRNLIFRCRNFLGWLLLISLQVAARAELTWQEALSAMPVNTNVLRIAKTAAPQLIFNALRKNEIVKGIVFLPAATDELYFFDHGSRTWAGQPGSLTDALTALTNGTPFKITYQKPLLLVHLDRDRLDTLIPKGALWDEYRTEWSGQWIDLPWERAHSEISRVLRGATPAGKSTEAYHFYRIYLAGQGMSGFEFARAVALAGRLKVVQRGTKLHFALDERAMLLP